MPQIFLHERSHAQGSRVQRQPVPVGLDFQPVHHALVWFADHAVDIRLGFRDPAGDVTDIRHHVFEVFEPLCV